MSLGVILRKLWWKQHILKNENEGKNVLILLFLGNFSYTCWFLCNLLSYLPLATDIWWVSVIFNFIWPVLTDIGLIFKFLIISPWKITLCRKNILSDIFSRGYPVWKCELWLDLSNKTQKHNSAGCDHELHIVGEQPMDYYAWFTHDTTVAGKLSPHQPPTQHVYVFISQACGFYAHCYPTGAKVADSFR